MSITHVMFDLDGTLLDTLEDLALAGNHACEELGWPTFPLERYRYKVGNGIDRLIERIVPAEFAGDEHIFLTARDAFRTHYDAHKFDHTAPYPGVPKMLDELLGRGIVLAVLTNKDLAAAGPLVERFFGRRFQLVQGHVDGFPPKPDARITHRALETLGADPATTLYVGDSDVDVATGHNAGLAVAGAAWGFRGRVELETAGADAVIETPADLLSLIDTR